MLIHCSGMNVMMLYITYVFGMAGLSGNANLVASSIQYVINVFMTIFALIFIDRWGRRWPLIIGSTLMMTWMFANAGIMASYGQPAPPGGVNNVPEESWDLSGAKAAARGVIACTYLFVASFAPTWGPVSWIYPPELFPLRLRGKAVSVTTASNWIFNFSLSYFVPPAFENIKWKTYILFGVFCAAMTIHVFFCFPEVRAFHFDARFHANHPRHRARPSRKSSPCSWIRASSLGTRMCSTGTSGRWSKVTLIQRKELAFSTTKCLAMWPGLTILRRVRSPVLVPRAWRKCSGRRRGSLLHS